MRVSIYLVVREYRAGSWQRHKPLTLLGMPYVDFIWSPVPRQVARRHRRGAPPAPPPLLLLITSPILVVAESAYYHIPLTT